MFYPIGKSLHVICVSSVILKSDFLMKDLVIALFVFSLDLYFFDLTVSDSDSHMWCVTEVLDLRGCENNQGGLLVFLVL